MKAYDKIPEWNEIVFREPTAEEKEVFNASRYDYWIENLPGFNEEVLVTDGTNMWVDTIDEDNGIYLSGTDNDIDGVIAWLPLPKPYER